MKVKKFLAFWHKTLTKARELTNKLSEVITTNIGVRNGFGPNEVRNLIVCPHLF